VIVTCSGAIMRAQHWRANELASALGCPLSCSCVLMHDDRVFAPSRRARPSQVRGQ
jgi:hypothetical protein